MSRARAHPWTGAETRCGSGSPARGIATPVCGVQQPAARVAQLVAAWPDRDQLAVEIDALDLDLDQPASGNIGGDCQHTEHGSTRAGNHRALDLRVLVLVAQTGSIGQAALELGLSQPSVSRRMAGLERALRVPLLTRSPRGTTLTPAGRVVVDWASTLLSAAEQFTRSVTTLHDQQAVTVRAAVSMTIAEHHAPGWVARVGQHAPDAVVSLMVHNSREVAELVESGDADIGFVESPTSAPRCGAAGSGGTSWSSRSPRSTSGRGGADPCQRTSWLRPGCWSGNLGPAPGRRSRPPWPTRAWR